jgi:hypothetical protein
MHANEVIRRYSARPALFPEGEKVLLINVNRSALERDLYEATRYAWKLSVKKARQAKLVLATVQGMIVGAFIPEEWLDATAANFPGREGVPGRWGFRGKEAPKGVRDRYVGKRVPDEYRKRGAANPVKYAWGR